MKTNLLAPLLILSALFTQACIVVDDSEDSTLTIRNSSSYFIDEIYISQSSASGWGPNFLSGGDFLAPNESITFALDCDFWDVQIVDQDGVICEFYDVDLCFDDEVWRITNGLLDSCLGVRATDADTSVKSGVESFDPALMSESALMSEPAPVAL